MASAWTTALVSGLLAASLGRSVNAVLTSTKRQEVGTCTSLNQRKSWTALTDAEKKAYIDADLCLQSTPAKFNETGIEGAVTRWDELHWSHIVQANVIHDVGQFLPFHRLYMRAHEVLLQTECGYTGAQPYWDELADVNALMAGNLTYPELAVFDTELGLGGNGEGDGLCVTTGPFANLTLRMNDTLGVGLYSGNGAGDEYCLQRNLNVTQFILKGNQTNIDLCNALDNYDEAWNCWFNKPHGAGHSGIKGTMGSGSGSPGDPFFFLHHTYLDRLWWRWQQGDLTTRLTDLGSVRNIPTQTFLDSESWPYPTEAILNYDGDDGNVTTLNHVMWMVGLVPNATVAEMMDLGSAASCAEYVG